MTREEKINTLKAIIQECEEYQRQRKETLFEIIKDLEQKPKTGHWKPYLKEGLTDMCSECGSRFDRPWNYCPNCRAKMVKPKESEVEK